MGLASVLFLAGGVWVCVLGVFVALCRAAKLGDEALVRAVVTESPAIRPRRHVERSHLRLVGSRTVGLPSGRR